MLVSKVPGWVDGVTDCECCVWRRVTCRGLSSAAPEWQGDWSKTQWCVSDVKYTPSFPAKYSKNGLYGTRSIGKDYDRGSQLPLANNYIYSDGRTFITFMLLFFLVSVIERMRISREYLLQYEFCHIYSVQFLSFTRTLWDHSVHSWSLSKVHIPLACFMMIPIFELPRFALFRYWHPWNGLSICWNTPYYPYQ